MTPVATEAPAETNPAASSPATTSEPVTLDSLSDSEYHEWRLTKKLPERQAEQPSTAASTPAVPAEQAAETAASDPPASEPGKPSKKNAETRKAELTSEILALKAEVNAMRAEREALQRQTVSAPQPAVSPESRPAGPRPLVETIQAPDINRPPLAEEEFFAQYPDAKIGDFTRYTARYELVAHEQVRQALHQREQRRTAYAERMKAVGVDINDQTYWADKDPRLTRTPTVLELGPNDQAGPLNVIVQEIFEADNPKVLIEHLSTNKAELDSLAALPSMQAIARAIGRLEAKLTATASPPAPAGNPVSSAPPPPTTLGKKPAQPANELEDAIARGDVAAYMRLTNQQQLQRRKSG